MHSKKYFKRCYRVNEFISFYFDLFFFYYFVSGEGILQIGSSLHSSDRYKFLERQSRCSELK